MAERQGFDYERAAFWRDRIAIQGPESRDRIIELMKDEASLEVDGSLLGDDEDGVRRANLFVQIALGNRFPLRDYVEDYLLEKSKDTTPKTVDLYRTSLERLCQRFETSADVTKRAVREWVTELRDEGLADKTLGRTFSAIRGYWAYLIDRGILSDESDPFAGAARPAEKGRARRVRLYLVRRRPAARRLQAVRVRPRHPAVHGAPAPGLRAGATKAAALAEYALRTPGQAQPGAVLLRVTGRGFYNTSPLDMPRLMGDQDNIAANLFSTSRLLARGARHLRALRLLTPRSSGSPANLLYLVTEKFANIDLHPERRHNDQMGLVFEELIRKFAEISNETAGEHFTPREVIRLMVNLLFIEDDDAS
jgi:hypothetical protein